MKFIRNSVVSFLSVTLFAVSFLLIPQVALAESLEPKEITSFSFPEGVGVITGTNIAVTVPFGTDVTALTSTIVHTGASVSPASGSVNDFTSPVTFTVTATDETTQDYTVTVTVTPASNSKDITAFGFPEGDGTIDGSSIDVTVPYGTDVTYLTPTITHTGVSVNPSSGSPQDFSEPVTYTVLAEDESSQEYTVTVTVAAPSTAKDITAFSFPEGTGTIDGTDISVTVPYGTDVSELVPTIEITGVSVDPPSGEMHGFDTPRVYTVTAEDSSTKEYTVTVTVGPAPLDITPASGTYTSAQTITITADTESHITIYYTTDGSTPDRSDVEGYEGTSFAYEGPFSLDGNDGETKTVKARYYDGEGWSSVVSRTYTFSKTTGGGPVVSGGGYFVNITPSGFTAPIVQSQTPAPQGTVLGATASCKESGPHLSKYARIGYNNDVDTVKKLQEFLNKEIDAKIPVTGFFGKQTEEAVKKYQLLHKETLLAPWGITEPTGILYITTLAHINHSFCADFPLTPAGLKLIPFNENPDTPKKL